MVYKKILVGIDGSEASLKTARRAAEIAKSMGSSLLLVSIVPPPTVLLGELLVPEVVDTRPLKEAAEKALSKLKETIASDYGIEAQTIVAIGDPGDQIVEIASQEDVDLIVVGRRGLSRLERLFIGSVTKKVLERTHTDVLVVI